VKREKGERTALIDTRYHHLNHYSIFGGGYRGGAVRIMESLLKKFGG
jgi:protein-ribulosamine 3-kinase